MAEKDFRILKALVHKAGKLGVSKIRVKNIRSSRAVFWACIDSGEVDSIEIIMQDRGSDVFHVCVLAHELGHVIINKPKYIKHKNLLEKYDEEVKAWGKAKELLYKLDFKRWRNFESIRGSALRTYELHQK